MSGMRSSDCDAPFDLIIHSFMPAKRAEVSDARWARMLRHVAVVEQKLVPDEASGTIGSTVNGAQDPKDMAWASISLADPNIKLTVSTSSTDYSAQY